MARGNDLEGRGLSTAELLIGIVASAGALVCAGYLLMLRAKPGAWSGVQIGLVILAAILAGAAAYMWVEPLNEAVGPQEGGRPRAQLAGGLAGLLIGIGLLAVLVVQKIGEQPFGKTEIALLVLALLGVAACVAVWWEPISQGCTSRGALLQLNAGVVTLLVLVVLFLANYYIIPRRLGYLKLDMTKNKFYSLSSQTTNLVGSIKKDDPVELIALIPRGKYGNDQDLHVVTKRLEDYGRLGPNLTIRILDPYIDSEANELAEKGVVTAIPAVVVRKKNNPEQRESVSGTEEADITKALLKLQQPSSRKIYFLSGRGEVGLEGGDQYGVGELKTRLTNDRYECATLELMKTASIPTDAALLVSVGANLPYTEDELKRLDAYLAGGGRLLAFMDAGGKGNLGTVLAKYGIEWHAETVIDPAMMAVASGDIFLLADYADHDVTKVFKRARRYLCAAFKSGYFKAATGAGDFQTTELLKASSASYAEKGKGGPKTNGPLAVAMASGTKDADPKDEAKKDAKDKDKDKPAETDKKRIRVVAFGDAKFPSDLMASQGVKNVDVVANAVGWLTDNAQVTGIAPKDPMKDRQERPIVIDAKGKKFVVILTLLLPLVLLLAAGVTVRVVRR